MVKTWAKPGSHRFNYIKRSLPSLLDSDLPDAARVVVVDDQSTDPRLTSLLKELEANGRIQVWTNPTRMGPNGGQAYNFPLLIDRFPGAELFALCDDDIIYHPGWLQRLIAVYEDAKRAGLTGIFSALNVPIRPSYGETQLPTSRVLLKERQAALNWLVPRSVYDTVGPFRDIGVAYDTEYCDRMAAHKLPVVCMVPSYVQNIGYHGAYQNSDAYTAPDYVGKTDLWLRTRDVLYVFQGPAQLVSRAGRKIARLLRGGPA